LAIARTLVARDAGNTEWRRDLSISDNKVGDVLSAQGKTSEALAFYQDSLVIRKALAAKDPGNTDWQRDVSVGDEKIGDALKAEGKLDDALAAYRDCLAIRKGLVARNPNITEWQRDTSVADNKVGDVLSAQGQYEDALASYRDGLAIAKALVARSPGNSLWKSDLQFSVNRIGSIAYNLVLVHEFAPALGAADDALATSPDLIWPQKNRAHALMFLGRTDDARALYLQFQKAEDVLSGKSWTALVLDNFAEFRKAGLTSPLMDEIEKMFST
jgi:tetratricopeptide (TPR) repeat protein